VTVREDIATAASTVDGITASPYYKQGTNPGRAWVRLDRIEYPNPFGGIFFWNLVVVLPKDMAQAEQYIEQKVPLINGAIEEFLVIDEVAPQWLNINGVGDLLCVFINGHREE
jgi:hypothetical protein